MKLAVLFPCYKRPEYTAKALKALEDSMTYSNTDFYLVDDGSKDGTDEMLLNSKLPNKVVTIQENIGLRNTIIDFFSSVKGKGYDFLVKMDNDCAVPSNWLNDLIGIFQFSDVDILSPNVEPSNAAFKNGRDSDGLYRPSNIVGGLWAMKSHLPNDVYFDRFDVSGIKGAFHILNQIIVEKEPIVGWAANVTVQDIGHWSGLHPEHIKSEAHAQYSAEVGRTTAW